MGSGAAQAGLPFAVSLFMAALPGPRPAAGRPTGRLSHAGRRCSQWVRSMLKREALELEGDINKNKK